MKGLALNTKSSSSSDQDIYPTVLLSLQNRRDGELIQNALPDSFSIELHKHGDQINADTFDLCILDEHSFQLYREDLQNLKEQALPVFLPVLLLSKSEKRVRSNSVLLEFADDVIYIPATKKLIESRIKLLLRQREYSLKLEEKNRQFKKKNRELVEEKRRYQLLAKNSTDMITRHTPDGTYLYVSPASEELLGYQPEELVGHNAFDIIHPDDEHFFRRKTLFQSDQIESRTFRKRTKEGSYKWVETTMRPIINEDTGKVTEIQASTRDISARKEYEKKLKEEKEFIDKAVQSMPELFYIVDEEQKFIKWNNIEKELGYSSDEINEMQPLDFYRKEDHKIVTEKMQEAFKSGHAELEIDMKAKSGEMIPYFITGKKFTRGEKDFLVGSCINLSDIKEAEYELKQHQQLLNAIINQTKSLIYLKDKDRKYRLVNDSYLAFYDLDREKVIGHTDREVHGDDFAEEVGESDYKVIEERQTIEIEERRSNKEKSRLYHTIKYPLRGIPGLENCMCGISTDITDLKEASDKLQERIKEQKCLYNVSSLSENGSVDQLLEKAVQYLPEGWKYPEVTEAAIVFDGKSFKTDGYGDTKWKLTAENNGIEDKPLLVHVVYTTEQENRDEGPFLQEERQLIESVADTLSSQINRIIAQQKLKESRKRWESLVKNAPDLIQILEPDTTIQFINEAGARILGYEDPKELIGKNYLEIIELTEDEEELTENRVHKVLEGKKIGSQIFKIRDAKGDLLYLESQAVPIQLDDGRMGLQQVAQNVTDRVEYERELKKSLKEKETLLQEVHHRVKNNLAVVSGMMELQTFRTQNQEVRNQLSDSKNRIKTMALIHEKLYQSKLLSRINFGSYVEDLLQNIRQVSTVSDKITMDLNYNSFHLNVNQAVPCALIINEIISNSYEHAFTNQTTGNIVVRLEEKKNIITIRVSDNGKGLPSNFNKKKTKSLGYTIINTLIKQLNAETEIKNKNGLSFTFSFEKQELKGSSSTLLQ